MKKRWNILAMLAALVAGGSAFASNPGELTVRDGGKLFTAEGIKAAKDAFASHSFDSATKVTVVTFDGLPSRQKADFEKLKDSDKEEKDRLIGEWVKDEAKADGAKGIFILVSTKPNYIRVIADEQMRIDRKFGEAKARRMQELMVDAFKASKDLSGEAVKQGHDVGLAKALEYAGEQLMGTSAVTPTASHSPTSHKVQADKGGSGMGGLLGWVCIIGVALLVVWLLVGLFRALTGMGGGYGGGGMGGGYGGGGGGFMSSLMGGMFGSMAGMWMYNNFMGGGMNSMQAGDYGGGGYTGDTGGGASGGEAGNFDNGADGGGGGDWGGDAGSGDAGGGDFGGGDFGGGDFGGGGGDFGGGGGDW